MSLVLVVGAGPSGMTAAIELKRFGLDVRIIDKSDHLAQHSQALVVQPRTLEQWQRYGIAEQAVKRGRKLTEGKFWSDGKNIASIDLSQIPSRYPYVLFLPQTETEAILNETMEKLGVSTERGTELVSLSQTKEGASATIRKVDGTEEEIHPRWVIGCDGSHSWVRKAMGIPFEGGSIAMSFFLGDMELEGQDVPQDELAIHLHKGDVVFMGRLSDKITRLIVAVHNKQQDQAPKEITIKDFQDAVDNAHVKVKVLSSEWMTPFHVTDMQAKHYRSGSVFLAGDASHIHSPVGGQGMNTGIQDIANLAWKIAAVENGAQESILDSYEEERSEVGKALLSFTERGLKFTTSTNPIVESARDLLLPYLSQLHPIQRRVVGFISELGINYQSSSIVSDQGGDGSLRAGDRLPDLTTGPSTLLENWTEPLHLAVLLVGNDSQAINLSGIRQISINSSELDEEGQKLLGSGPKLLLIRPDGYIGYRGPIERSSELEAYLKQIGIQETATPKSYLS